MIFNFVLIVFFIILFLYALFKKRYLYFADRGIPFDPPIFPYGSMQGAGRKFHGALLHQKLYEKNKKNTPILGLFTFISKLVLVMDLDLIKTVMVKDFDYFVNRGMYFNEKDDPMSAHLVAIEDEKWRNLRAKLTPTFTTGKMKYMFPTITAVADELKKCIERELQQSSEIEMKDILARFTTDVIGSCAFGIECNSLTNPHAEFREMGKKILDVSLLRNFLFLRNFRTLGRMLRMTSSNQVASKFFLKVVRETVDYREANNIKRNDFMDLLIDLKNGKSDDVNSKITFNEIAAQAYVFFAAGFETSSTAVTYAIYELSLNSKIQDRAREEVMNILEKHGGEFTYESLSEMKYIEHVIYESLRKYPPIAAVPRKASKKYTFSGTNMTIEKGVSIIIPLYAIHHDPDLFPNPEVFDPDRFLPEQVEKRHPFAFLPFGEGPRGCIGMRFGIMQAKIGLATLLANFKYSKCSKSKVPLNFLPNSLFLVPDGGLWLKVDKI